MRESYTRSIGVSPTGAITIRHGDMTTMDILDGYSISSIPEPRTGSPPDYKSISPVYLTSTGEAWTVEDKALKQFRKGQWTIRATPAPGEVMITAIPLDGDHVVVLFQDHVAEFDASRNQWSSIVQEKQAGLGAFRRMVRSFSGKLWIAGSRGVGSLDPARGYHWTPCESSNLEDFDYPLPGDDEALFAVATTKAGHTKVAVRVVGGRFQTVFTSAKDLRVWPGADDDLWVLEGSTLWKLNGSHQEAVDKEGPLSGIIYDVRTEPGGGFWIGANTGLAHYTPPLWRTPGAVRHIDQPVHDITEDAQGHLWFAATESLLELEGAKWKIHPLPDDLRTQTFLTASLTALIDGRIAFMALQSGQLEGIIVTFDPRTGKFERRHKGFPDTHFMWRRDSHSVWVQALSPCQLAVWDGRSFTMRPDLQIAPKCQQLRLVRNTSNGDIWVGTTSLGGGVFHAGSPVLHEIGKTQGYPELAIFALHEFRPGVMIVGGRETLAEFSSGEWKTLRTNMDAVRSIVRSRDGTLWVAAGSGVHRRKDDAWVVNGEPDGLRSDSASVVFEDKQGRVWVGTTRGLSRYYPEADQQTPRVMLAKNNAAETLPDGNATLSFTGSDRWKQATPDHLLFSTRLDGGKWSGFAAATTVSFPGLKHGPHHFEVRALDRNGNVSPIESFAFRVVFPWYLQAGFLVAAFTSLVAISALVWLAVRQYRQIIHAKQTAEAANRSKSEFLANMSHEIRTPMNAVMGMTDLAAAMAVNQEQKEYLGIVQSASASLLGLLNDILDLSKVEAGKLALVAEDFDVRQCVENSIATWQVSAREKNLGLHCRIAPDTPDFIRGDDLRLRQILLNLLGNAIKFTAAGEVVLCVQVTPSSLEKIRLRFTVSDTGPGIPPEKQRTIFEPFEQADASTTRKHGGTGLGLAICTRLVHLMQGSIRVESPWRNETTGEITAGTALHFEVEFRPGSKPRQTATEPRVMSAKRLRVLVADDNSVNQLLAVRLVEKLGHIVLVAGTGEEAVKLYEREMPDVVLMDVQMPVMDGFEATAAIRTLEAGTSRRIRIIALTAHALQGYREDCLRAGMDDYLPKPVQLNDLARTLGDVSLAVEVDPPTIHLSPHEHPQSPKLQQAFNGKTPLD